MKIWAIGDLHLSFGVPNKEMGIFGKNWVDHDEKIKKNWLSKVSNEDVILIPGDISWAMCLDEALVDLQWIDDLTGKKILIKGNHDYWWNSTNKVRKILPPSISVIESSHEMVGEIAICGARMWEDPSIKWGEWAIEAPPIKQKPEVFDNTKIYAREMHRLEKSLISGGKSKKIAMLHYPPTSPDHRENNLTKLLEKHNVTRCIYGHLHNIRKEAPVNFKKNDIVYKFTSCDFIEFTPIRVV